MSHTVRPYQDSDLQDLLTSWDLATAAAHPFLTEDFLTRERFNIPNLYLPMADTWVVEQEGKVIGFIALIGNEVGAIFVRPDCHGTGAGRALMDHASTLHENLEVEVFKENAIGRKFYSSYGFKVLSERVHDETGNELLRLRYSVATDDI
jgi:putative acetyltransferase